MSYLRKIVEKCDYKMQFFFKSIFLKFWCQKVIAMNVTITCNLPVSQYLRHLIFALRLTYTTKN